MKIPLLATSILLLSSCAKNLNNKKNSSVEDVKERQPTPYEVVAQAAPSEWRDLDPSNSLYLQLPAGMVVLELAPDFAPGHVENTKALVREGVFDGTTFYRVIDGFVAQGGPGDPEKLSPPKSGSLSIAAEFSKITDSPLPITAVGEFDGYADETGFYKGFAMGRSKDQTENWLLHCYGAFAMGRANDINSGGTELYIVNGNSQRYLDRNTTVFGRVVAGMEHIQALQRTSGLNGNQEPGESNTILKISVGSDLPKSEQLALEIMDTSSDAFGQLIASRKNRTGEWFVHAKNYIDACSIPVPARLKSKPE